MYEYIYIYMHTPLYRSFFPSFFLSFFLSLPVLLCIHIYDMWKEGGRGKQREGSSSKIVGADSKYHLLWGFVISKAGNRAPSTWGGTSGVFLEWFFGLGLLGALLLSGAYVYIEVLVSVTELKYIYQTQRKKQSHSDST